ncbi:MAG: hypothetical protein ACW97X_13040 [Candidatus Hodarchaeales archaeon]
MSKVNLGYVIFQVTVFEEARGFLNSSIRTYVGATSTLDKLFAVKLVMLSMIVATDALIENIGNLSKDTPFKSSFEESNFFFPMVAYDQRIADIISLEEKNLIPSKLELSRRLRKTLDTFKVVCGEYGLKTLLAIDIKQYINDSQFFIIDIQELVEK